MRDVEKPSEEPSFRYKWQTKSFQQRVKSPELLGWLSKFQSMILNGLPNRKKGVVGNTNLLGVEKVGLNLLKSSGLMAFPEDKGPGFVMI
eukprot:9236377-Karenia_brevis.AAC.1